MGEAMNIIELAKQAGFVEYELDDGTTEAFDKRYAKFAALVAAHEREECAKLAENRMLDDENKNKRIGHHHACNLIAIDIRARGTT
jgi:hypothetical protein